MAILAIDPGTTKSGWCTLGDDGSVEDFGWWDNEDVQVKVNELSVFDMLVIEDISNYGMAVGRDTFETVKWMGRFDTIHYKHQYITRPTIKTALCGQVTATDSNVRQAVIDWYGGDAVAIGGKKCLNCKGKGWTGREHKPCEFCPDSSGYPDKIYLNKEDEVLVGCGYETHKGQLHGVSSHVWSALALGITYIEQEKATI
jgi:hypothetical protein